MNYNLTLLISFFLLTVSPLNGQTTIILQPGPDQGKDAILHGLSSEQNTNYGNNDQLPASEWTFFGTPGVLRSVLDFDLSIIPAGSAINSAQLSLYAWDSDESLGQHSQLSGSNEARLERVTSDWDENTVTWNNQPTTTSDNEVILPASSFPSQDYIDIDVAAMVQDMINDPASSFGFLLRLQNETYYRLLNFASSDHINSAIRPKIEITYTEPVIEEFCVTLQPDAEDGKDAILHGLPSEANTNYGDNNQLPAAGWTFFGAPGVLRSALAFDLAAVPLGSTVTSASLSLYAWDSEGSMGQHSQLSGSNASLIKRITTPWDESTVTWNSQPDATGINQVSIAPSTSPYQDYENIDVSNLVQDMIDNPTSSFGFLIMLQNENYYRLMNFASSDHINSALHPMLEICYSQNALSVTEIDQNDQGIQLFPNPSSDIVNIVFTNNKSKTNDIEIYNAHGQIVQILSAVKSEVTIDVSNLAKGMYYVKIGNSESVSTKKLIVN